MRKFGGLLVVLLLVATSCEEIIDIDLNTAEPRYVIEADILGGTEVQKIRVTQTVAFDDELPSKSVDDAEVRVQSADGRTHRFYPIGQGYYQTARFMPRATQDYTLSVRIGEQVFVAKERMPDFVPVDSVGVVEETIFNELTYSILFKFDDPAGEDNYYKYAVSVNEQPFRFLQVQSDKYNNGLYVSHQLMDYTKQFALGDTIVIRRQCISKAVFDYWNEVQLMNPGAAAPANPKSNISNGALGYFSVSPFREYGVYIRRVDQERAAKE